LDVFVLSVILLVLLVLVDSVGAQVDSIYLEINAMLVSHLVALVLALELVPAVLVVIT